MESEHISLSMAMHFLVSFHGILFKIVGIFGFDLGIVISSISTVLKGSTSAPAFAATDPLCVTL